MVEYYPISSRDKSRLHRFGKNVVRFLHRIHNINVIERETSEGIHGPWSDSTEEVMKEAQENERKVRFATLMGIRHIEKYKDNPENFKTGQGSVARRIWKQKRNAVHNPKEQCQVRKLN